MKIKSTCIEDFIECEYGAHEDDIRGPSPLTTVEILQRSTKEIIINTPEEAAQIADCCMYGTFPQHHPNAADRIFRTATTFPGMRPVMEKHDAEQWNGLAELIQAAQ